MENPKDPVFRRQDGWHFWDEGYKFTYGPYATQGIARLHLINYIHETLKIAAEKVEKINEELKTHNKICVCDPQIIPDDQVFEVDEEDNEVIPMPVNESGPGLTKDELKEAQDLLAKTPIQNIWVEPKIKDPIKDLKLPEIKDIWVTPKTSANDSTSSNTLKSVGNSETKKKKELSTTVILIIWAVIVTALITAFTFSDFKFSSLFPDVTKRKIEVVIKEKPKPNFNESAPTITPAPTENKQSTLPTQVCIRGYDHYTKFMNQTEEVLKKNDFGISVWENPGASKGNMVGKIKPGVCIEKLDQQGNNIFVQIEGAKVGWIHVMDTVPQK